MNRDTPELHTSDALSWRERRPKSTPAAGLLVLHHGRGSDEVDLLQLADILDPKQEWHVVSPRAPLEISGLPGFHWYKVKQVGYPDHDSFHSAYNKLGILHNELWLSTGIPPERTVLAGFSMGAVMSYALGLGLHRPSVAGILAFSGFIPVVDGWRPDGIDRQSTHVLISHGTADAVIDVDFGIRACELLSEAGIDVEFQQFSGGHWIDPVHAKRAQDWLNKLSSSWK